jgi:hypothetical protein
VIYDATMIADATIVFDGHVIADATMVFDVITETTKITDTIMVYDDYRRRTIATASLRSVGCPRVLVHG